MGFKLKNRDKIFYEGKAKILYFSDKKNTLIQYFKDDTTAFNAKKMDKINKKGILNNFISAHLFKGLEQINIPHHFIKIISEREQLIKQLKIFKIEIISRNYAAGSICKRLGINEGYKFNNPLIEFCLKDDKFNDPIISKQHIQNLQLASKNEIKKIIELTSKINYFLTGIFYSIGIKFIDFKLEFGKSYKSNDTNIYLADEISPDNCRLWDIDSNKKLDKDRYRDDLGGLLEAYLDVSRRLGIKKVF